MELFSERMGYSDARKVAQVESMDGALRNRIWNVLEVAFWRAMREDQLGETISNECDFIFVKLWDSFFKWSTNEMPTSNNAALYSVKRNYDDLDWHQVYSFVEYMILLAKSESNRKSLIKALNTVFKEELSGYRIVGSKVVPIVAEAEIGEIEEALASSPNNVSMHLRAAIEFISDKGTSDVTKYRNCIKESISAVEALCNQILGKKCSSLGQCLKKLEEQQKIPLHKALSNSLQSLYGWTSDAEGIRHPLMDEPSLTLEDARFMLITCSAFTNYLLSKASQAGIEL